MMDFFAIIFPIIIICTSVSGFFTQSRRYDELQMLGNPCFPRDTCQSLNDVADDNLWNDRICECEEHCVRYQTCCIDSSYFGMQQVAGNSFHECQHVQTTDDDMVYMVSTCLQEWGESYTYEKCVNPEAGLKDPLSEVPVTSTASMNTYRNIFCALCNNDAGSAVLWDIGVKIPKSLNLSNNALNTYDDVIEKMVYNSAKNSWGFYFVDPQTPRKQQFIKFHIKFSVKDELKKFVKPCHPEIISECNPFYKSTCLHYKCLAYYSPISVRIRGSPDFLNYRNIHCALCNGLKVHLDEFACLLKPPKRQRASLSFTKLLDVNRKDGDIVGKTSLCKEGQMYDPFFKKCRSIGCAMPNHIIRNGACIKSD